MRLGRFRYHAVLVAAVAASTAAVSLPNWGAASASPRAPAAGALTDVGHAAALPSGTRRLGPLAARSPIRLDVTLKPRDPAALARFAAQVSSPGSPFYGRYLRQGQFASRFGPTPATVSAVSTTLRRLGLRPSSVSQNRLIISIHTTAAVAERALRTPIDRFALASGRLVFANTAAPRLPEAIAPRVQAVVGLDDIVRLVPSSGARRAAPQTPSAPTAGPGPKPCSGARRSGAETADKLASAYGFKPLYSAGYLGQGKQMALFEAGAYSASDVKTYQRCYHTSTKVTVTSVDGGVKVGNGSLEATSDVEDLIGLAPKAHIRVYQTKNQFQPNWLDEWTKIVDDNKAAVVSTSWLACEKYLPHGFAQSENTLFQQAATQKQTVLAASGDYGSEACDQFGGSTKLSVDDPASQVYVTGVGGTQWKSRTPPRAGERTWNSHKSGAGGGGLSSLWAMPEWQTGPGVVNKYSSGAPCKASVGYCREVPDVSALSGAPYYAFYCKAGDCSSVGGWGYFWGTSFATPLWAAAIALADQSCAAHPRAGWLDPTLYSLANSSSYPHVLHDITSGNNDFTHSHHGDYPASSGYDLATGLGTPLLAAKGGSPPGLAAALCP